MHNFLILTSGAVLAVFFLKRLLTSKRNLPPGPKGWPIIGNLFDMPRERTWLAFSEMGKKYGEISSLTVLGQPIIVINSRKVATELLSAKSQIYSDRPTLPMGGELIGWKNTLPLVKYGEVFNRYRKMFHQAFGTQATMRQHNSFEESVTKTTLRRILDDPDDLYAHARKHFGTIALKLVYGYDIEPEADPVIQSIHYTMTKSFSVATAPGGFLVDVLPILRFIPSWLPGGGFHKTAEFFAQGLSEMGTVPYHFAKEQFANGTAGACFTSENLTPDVDPQSDHIIKWTASSIAAGGFITRTIMLRAFLLAMSLNPEVQKRAQAEIDSVIGSGRFPTYADRPNLPYTNALCREVLRFHAIVPTGLPHVVMEDDIYDGYFIPKGSIVIANIWNMLNDPETHREPEKFDPSRYLGSDGRAPEKDVYDYAYGFGRRLCPGRAIADVSMFIFASMTLAVLDVSKAVDEKGNEIEPVVSQLSGSVSQPTPFSVSVKPRSAEALALLMAED